MASQHFRAGVVIVIRHPDRRRVLAVERADQPGSWQLPQGGLDAGEELQDGAWRELAEETGLGPDDVAMIAEFPEWTLYEYPDEIRSSFGKRRGQAHRWFLFDALTEQPPIACDGREVRDWRWVEPSELIDEVIEFRRATYERVLSTL